MGGGEHPCICLTCRKKLGPAYSVVWVAREALEKETRVSFDAMERDVSGIVAILRSRCDDCINPIPALTSSASPALC